MREATAHKRPSLPILGDIARDPDIRSEQLTHLSNGRFASKWIPAKPFTKRYATSR